MKYIMEKKLILYMAILALAFAMTPFVSAKDNEDSGVTIDSTISSKSELRKTFESQKANFESKKAEMETKKSEAAEKIKEMKDIKDSSREANKSKADEMRKDNGIKEIDNRIESLKKLIEKITAFQKVSSSMKSTLSDQINSQITLLNDLKQKLQAETDSTKVKELKQSIVKDFRIYAVFMPKVAILAAADKILTITADLKTTTTDANMLATLSSAENLAQKAITTANGVTPEGFPANKTSLQSAKKDLISARDLLKKLKSEKESTGSSKNKEIENHIKSSTNTSVKSVTVEPAQ